MSFLRADDFTYNADPSDIVQRLIRTSSPRSATDIGAGAGRNTNALLQAGCHVTAVECGPESITILKSINHPNLTVLEGTLQDLTLNHQFEAVLCTMTLHFLRGDEIPKALEKLHQLTAPGGRVCVSAYIDCTENQTLPPIYTYKFAPGELRRAFDHGWRLEFYVEEFPVPSVRVMQSGINGGKGYVSARLIAQRI